ncbi:MAG TPA: DUF3786 domain-containing protein [Nitrospirota bacterium]|nr:DUF3786 domain-containing protein [Nitrospirota bacterium]
MTKITTPLQIYKLLPKTNCGGCRISTCLAFAAAVMKQEARLGDCPNLAKDVVDQCEKSINRPSGMEDIREEQLKELKKEFGNADILVRCDLLGARRKDESIVVQCLGKDFEIDRQGNVASQCHTHAWFLLPLFDYILHSKGKEASGRWAPMREMQKGKKWAPLFEQRCEKPLKKIADAYSDLFADLVTLFNAESAQTTYNSDVSVILHPFPKVPVLICYWKQEDDIESKLLFFFDDKAEENLSVESLFNLGTGLVRMFERIMYKHTDGKSEMD